MSYEKEKKIDLVDHNNLDKNLNIDVDHDKKSQHNHRKKLIKSQKIELNSIEKKNENISNKKDHLNNDFIKTNPIIDKPTLEIKEHKNDLSIDSIISSINDSILINNFNKDDHEINNNIKTIKVIEEQSILQKIKIKLDLLSKEEPITLYKRSGIYYKFTFKLMDIITLDNKNSLLLEMACKSGFCSNYYLKYNIKIDINNDPNSSNLLDFKVKSLWPIILFFFEKWFINFKDEFNSIVEKETDKNINTLQKNVLFSYFQTIERNFEIINTNSAEYTSLNNKSLLLGKMLPIHNRNVIITY